MNGSEDIYHDLRGRLDVLGYTQSLPPVGIPLVGALFQDLLKTTTSLRDAKKKIVDLLEEKSCWELGVEPYKCDNSRLLAECNELHIQLLKNQEEFEDRIRDYHRKIRTLESDKIHLDAQCNRLQQQLEEVLSNQEVMTTKKKQTAATHKLKKPFISTVRSGHSLPRMQEITSSLRCTKCNAGYYQRGSSNVSSTMISNMVPREELDKVQNNVKQVTDQLDFYKRKVEARNREIHRLNDLLAGGRPPAALAKDCCYKDVGAMSQDIDLLQREKSEFVSKIRDTQDQMHEAMQRALDLEHVNRTLQKELDELKDAAMLVETQANIEVESFENKIKSLTDEIARLRTKSTKTENVEVAGKQQQDSLGGGDSAHVTMEKRKMKERLNELTQKESDMQLENAKLEKKVQKMKLKMCAMQKDLRDQTERSELTLDEEKIRLKSERDFFQKEYLRLLSKAGSDTEIEFLHAQIKSKDDELRILRSEVCTRSQLPPPSAALTTLTKTPSSLPQTVHAATHGPSLPQTERSSNSSAVTSNECVQAIVLRTERERDCARAELERVRCERDTLRERHLSKSQLHAQEIQIVRQRSEELNERIKDLERENRDLNSARLPSQTHIVLLKEEIEQFKKRLAVVQEELSKQKLQYTQLKILHEQTERLVNEYQSKLTIAERQIQSADVRINTLDSNRESTQNETTHLRGELSALKSTYLSLEREKGKLMNQLDAKTERSYQLEYQLNACNDKRKKLEQQVTEMEFKLKNLSSKNRDRDTELHETNTESKSLRHQLAALKASREEAMAENGRLANELAESEAEIQIMKKKLKDSEIEIERLKQQLRQYVQEVKKAEDLLMNKEKERDEMLEHYRSLSHDAVVLEGNNQSLEVEAAEHKRQICDLEAEIETLKKDLCCRHGIIAQLEDKISALNTQNSCLERQLLEANDELCLQKVDLTARKELCAKLDIEKDKLNAELTEMNEIRRKLERDNELLRKEIEGHESGQKVSSETLEELLSKTRRDLEEQIQVDSKLSQELLRLRKQHDEVIKQIDTERQRCSQHKALAHEYQVQNEELRHNLTDDRFRAARSREQSPRYPATTL